MMNEQRFPAGWDEQRVKRLLAELDARTDEESLPSPLHSISLGAGEAL